MTGKIIRTIPIRLTILLLGMVISLTGLGAGMAWGCLPDPGVAIPACMIKASTTSSSGPWSTSSVSIAEGQTVYFKLFKTDGTELPANDIDTIGGVNNNYAFTYKWDFNYPSSWGGDNENPTDHAFSTAGTYTVKGRLDDDNSAYNESYEDSNNTISVTVSTYTITLTLTDSSSPPDPNFPNDPAIPQDGSTTATCTANLKLGGVNQSGKTITFTTQNGNGNFSINGTNWYSSVNATTDGSGNATAYIRSAYNREGLNSGSVTHGSDTVKAEFNKPQGGTVSDSKAIKFWDMWLTAPENDSWQKKGHLPADNGDEIAITATVSYSTAISEVRFYVSQDQQNWSLKGTDTSAPYQATWDTDESSSGTWYIQAIGEDIYGKTLADTHTISLFEIDLKTQGLSISNGSVADDGSHGAVEVDIADTAEDSPGAYVHYNVDNDNGNVDGSGNPIADYTETTSEVTDENDTMRMWMTIDPLPTTGSVKLERGNSNVNVWTGPEKGSDRALLVGDNSHTWNLADSGERNNYLACKDYLYAEGVALGSSTLTLTLKDQSGNTVGWDALQQTYLSAHCPDNQEPTPAYRSYYESKASDLVHCEWVITSEPGSAYNCVAWSVGETEIWFYAQNIDRYYGDVDGIFENADMDAFYSKYRGWSLITQGTDAEKAAQAEAMYYPCPIDWDYVHFPNNPPTTGYHAANKTECSCGAGKLIMYESKIGVNHRIEHVWNQIDDYIPSPGYSYGTPQRFYK